jgi:plasmid stability protein
MTSITIKNIPDDLYERLKAAAAANRRSINSEVIVAIEEAVGPERLEVDRLLVRARQLRSLTADHPLTEAALADLKNSGRP